MSYGDIMRKFLIFLLLNSTLCVAQHRITGTVVNDQHVPLKAMVLLLHSSGKVIAKSQADCSNGRFVLAVDSMSLPLSIVISHLGYQSDTIKVDTIKTEMVLGTVMLLPKNIMLGEVSVKGSNVTVRDGVKRIFPTDFHRQNSTDALIMLDKMNLSRISVDPLSKQITMNGGGTVKVLINGREASATEVSSISPLVIKRIDYHDAPEVRYGNADVVLDFITRSDDAGGRLYTSLWQGMATAFGEDYVSMKLNRKNSQFSIDYSLAYRNWHHLSRVYEETFNLPNDTLERCEHGLPGKFEYDNHDIHLTYNWQRDERQFNLSMGTGIKNSPFKEWSSLISATSFSGTAKDNANSSSFSPYLQVYWQMPVANNQLLYLNVAGQYTDGKFSRQYVETNGKSEDHSFVSNNKEKQKGYGLSAIYEAKENWGMLTLGIDFKQQFISSDFAYSASSFSSNHQFMRLSNLYAYAQWGRSWKKLYSRLSLGANQQETQVADTKQSPLTIRPSVFLRYTVSPHWEMRYQGYVANIMPGLAALSEYSQRIDFIQTQKGNPDLRSQMDIYNALVGSHRMKNMEWTLYLNHTYSLHPIMEYSYVDGNRIIRTQENHSSFQNYTAELSNGGQLWNSHISYNVFAGVKHYISHGNDYTHHYSIPYYGGQLSVYYQRYTLRWSIRKSVQDRYWGETLYRYEDGQMLSIGYQSNKLRILADVLNLFTKKHIAAMENFSAVAPYHRYEYLNETRNLIRLNVTLNLSFGKNYHERQPKLNQSTTTESSIIRGEK